MKMPFAALGLVGLGLFAVPAQAAPYDGKWVVDFPAVTVRETRSGCSVFRVVATVKDNQITATLERDPENLHEVENTGGPGAEPLTGTVAADGSFKAQWESFVVTGKLTGNSGVANVASSCGPRSGTATRVSAP